MKDARRVGGLCETCGKVCYHSRRDARRFARILGYARVNAYRCGDAWHIGHLPGVVKTGRLPRGALGGRDGT